MSPAVLLVSTRTELLEEVRAAAAAAGVAVETVASLAGAPARWRDTPTLLVGADALADCVGELGSHRTGLLVVSVGELAVELWPRVLDVGAEQVLALPRDRGALVAALARPPAGPQALLVGVVGGRGGAGASVLAARLASAFAAEGHDVLALDADPDGAGLDVVLAMEQVPGARWSRLTAIGEALPAQALRDALPTSGSLAVLAHDAASAPASAPGSLLRVLESARSAYDVVVVDLPRGRDDVLSAVVPACRELLVVVTGDVCGAAAAVRLLRRLGPETAPRLVVRETPGSELGTDELVGWFALPVAAELPHDSRLAAAIDHGTAPSPRSRWARAVRDLARGLAADRRRAA
jgi:secretion/DNA translocation related CpaE-like protein